MDKLDQAFFGYKWGKGQLDIILNIMDPDVNRLIISACTRYGKTQAVACGALLYMLENTDVKIALISPTHDQTSILRNYIAEHISENEQLSQLIDAPNKSNTGRLRKEASKKRVTFKGDREIRTFTAHGSGDSLMGFGADLVIVDQSEGVDDEVFRGKISRMLGESIGSKLVEIINPWERNHVWKHWNSERYERIHIDWRQAVDEDRLSEDFIDEQRENLTDYEFQVLYEAEFPEESEDSLFKYSWITSAQNRDIGIENGEHVFGLDVAGGGADLNVLTHTVQDDDKVRVVDQWSWSEADTMKTVGRVMDVLNSRQVDDVRVDKIGIGKGVADRLGENGVPVSQVHVGKQPDSDKDRFKNLKAQGYMFLRSLFEGFDIGLPADCRVLVGQLAEIGREYTSSGKVKIVDPAKSPDHADSLMLACLDLDNSQVEAEWLDNPFS